MLLSTPGDSGKSHKPAYVVLVGTHADKANIRKTSAGDFTSKQAEDLKLKIKGRYVTYVNDALPRASNLCIFYFQLTFSEYFYYNFHFLFISADK